MTRTRALRPLRALALAALTLAPSVRAVPAVYAPAASDRVRVGDNLHIAWSDLGTGLLNVHYQKGGSDTTWYSINAFVQATPGEYNGWQIQPLAGPMRVRITTAIGEDISYFYSGTFTVVQLDLSQPGFLTSWAANSTQNITWTYSNNAIPYVRLEYCLNGADEIPTWVTIRDSVPIFPATFAWTVPNATTSYARVRIREVNSNSVIHTGNAFAITGGTAIKTRGGSSSRAIGLSGEGAAVRFTLPAPEARVRLDVLDGNGRVVATPVNGAYGAGTHAISLKSLRLPAGAYTARLKTSAGETSQRIVLER
jgi:hypothetical protein